MKYFKSTIYIIFISLFILFIHCEQSPQNRDNVIVQIDGKYDIKFEELNDFLKNTRYNRLHPDKSRFKVAKKALKYIINDKLKIIDFFNKDLHENQERMKGIQRVIGEELVARYYRNKFLDKYTNDKAVKNAYEQMGKKVYSKQIKLPKPENASKDEIDSLKQVAKNMKSKIETGTTNFETLVNNYSQNIKKIKAETMTPITWKRSMTDPTYRVIYKFDSGDIRILETNNSINIVKVTDVEKKKLQPLKEIKDSLANELEKMYKKTSYKEFQNFKKKLVDTNTIEWNKEGIEQIQKWSNSNGFYQNKTYEDTINKALKRNNNFLIMNYNDGKIDLKKYLYFLNSVLKPAESSHYKVEKLKKYIVEALRTEKIIKKAREMGLDKGLINPKTESEYLKNQFVELYNKEIINSKIPEGSPKEYKEFYEEHKDSTYYQLAKVNVKALIYSNKEKADSIWSLIKNGNAFEDIANRWKVKTFIKTKKDKIKSYLSEEKPYLGEAAFKLEEGEVDGVVQYNDSSKDKKYAIIKCANKRPERQLTYQDVKDEIPEDFRKEHKQRIEHQVEQRLREKYKIKIFEDRLKKMMNKL